MATAARALPVWPVGAFRWGGEGVWSAAAGADAEFPVQVGAVAAAAPVWPGPGGFLPAQAVPEAAAEVARSPAGATAAGALPGHLKAVPAESGAWSAWGPVNQVLVHWVVVGLAPNSARENGPRRPWHSPQVVPNPRGAVVAGW